MPQLSIPGLSGSLGARGTGVKGRAGEGGAVPGRRPQGRESERAAAPGSREQEARRRRGLRSAGRRGGDRGPSPAARTCQRARALRPAPPLRPRHRLSPSAVAREPGTSQALEWRWATVPGDPDAEFPGKWKQKAPRGPGLGSPSCVARSPPSPGPW